jgi:hypothetical protein
MDPLGLISLPLISTGTQTDDREPGAFESVIRKGVRYHSSQCISVVGRSVFGSI